MAHSVSVLDGEVNRNWHLLDSRGEKHLLTLFHDCVTGARAAMLDYVEVPGSAGTTNLFNLVAGKVDIAFSLKDTPEDSGRLSILRRGLTGFSYECELNGRLVLDTTSVVQNTDYEYEVSLPASVDTGNRVNGVTWYEVHTMRKSDGKGTLVHRRFREFVALHNQVESLMKGHHLRSSLPRFPGKKSKLWTNHGDQSFVEDRRVALEQYMKTLLQLPHVSTLDSTRAFLGMVGNLREFSVPWNGKDLGATLKRASEVAGGNLGNGGAAAGDVGAPPVITSVLGKGRSPNGVCPGDRLFKVNGESTEHMSLEAAWSSVKRAARPVMLHFLGPILRMDSTLAPLPNAFLRRRAPDNQTADIGGAHPPPGVVGGLSHPNGGTGPSAGGNSAWGLRGMTQGFLPTWGRDQGKAGNVPVAAPTGTGPADADRVRQGRAVGPFGNGAGAAPGTLKAPTSNSLFGDGGGAGLGGGGVGGSGSADSWRTSSGATTGGTARQGPARPLGGGNGVVGSKGKDGWMPVMSAVPGGSASSVAPGKSWGPSARREGAGDPSRHTPIEGRGGRPSYQQWPAGSIASTGYPAENAGSSAIVWPPEQPEVTPVKPSGIGAKPSGIGAKPSGIGANPSGMDGTESWRGRISSERGAFGRGEEKRDAVAPDGFSAGADEGRRPNSVFASAPVGLDGASAGRGGAIDFSYGDAITLETSEDDGEEENPFA